MSLSWCTSSVTLNSWNSLAFFKNDHTGIFLFVQLLLHRVRGGTSIRAPCDILYLSRGDGYNLLQERRSARGTNFHFVSWVQCYYYYYCTGLLKHHNITNTKLVYTRMVLYVYSSAIVFEYLTGCLNIVSRCLNIARWEIVHAISGVLSICFKIVRLFEQKNWA